MIIGKPCIISNARKLEIAMLTDIPYEEIEAFIDSSVKLINEKERLNILNHNSSIVWLERSIILNNNNVYIELVYAYNSDVIFQAILEAVLYVLCDISVNTAEKRSASIARDLQEAALLSKNIVRLAEEIKIKYNRINFTKRADWAAFVKACKKYKLSPVETTGSIAFTFRNITTGNDIEGHIQYKAITFVWNKKTNSVVDVVYHFSKFALATSFGLRLALHPHISCDGEVCYGNRGEDMGIYKTANAYEYILDLLRDTVMSYNPESPYANVTKIAAYLRALNTVVPKDKNKLTTMRSSVDISQAWHNSIADSIRKCGFCAQYLDGGVCRNDNCIGNELAIINCPDCGQQLIWNMIIHRLTCPGHFICSVCGVTSIGSVCANPNCSTNSEVESV